MKPSLQRAGAWIGDYHQLFYLTLALVSDRSHGQYIHLLLKFGFGSFLKAGCFWDSRALSATGNSMWPRVSSRMILVFCHLLLAMLIAFCCGLYRISAFHNLLTIFRLLMHSQAVSLVSMIPQPAWCLAASSSSFGKQASPKLQKLGIPYAFPGAWLTLNMKQCTPASILQQLAPPAPLALPCSCPEWQFSGRCQSLASYCRNLCKNVEIKIFSCTYLAGHF